MPKTFMCYVHKPDHVTPELRVISCEAEGNLRATINAERPTWGPYDMIEVYDDGDHPLFRLTNTGRLSPLAAGG